MTMDMGRAMRKLERMSVSRMMTAETIRHLRVAPQAAITGIFQ
ncbi:hypothetical protein BV95_02114 [Sphingobium chlorophenolicum]|uniref:Uncharacterized protein n=1 Tax=Sphingobium chlorophenolicum TaxID=46429 RepID=A0A081REB0_SPHCR|nr:hypothetical protein BV95_02114 [Sphingobium chlorophenolicum]